MKFYKGEQPHWVEVEGTGTRIWMSSSPGSITTPGEVYFSAVGHVALFENVYHGTLVSDLARLVFDSPDAFAVPLLLLLLLNKPPYRTKTASWLRVVRKHLVSVAKQ